MAEASRNSPSGPTVESVRGKHILVVDDDPSLRAGVTAVLTRRGYRVSAVENGCSALEVFDTRGADLVVVDVNMPDMYGFQLAQEIRGRSDVPIVFVTGSNNRLIRNSLLQMVENSGGNSCLRKPLNLDQLVNVIHRFLDEGHST